MAIILGHLEDWKRTAVATKHSLKIWFRGISFAHFNVVNYDKFNNCDASIFKRGREKNHLTLISLVIFFGYGQDSWII